ncbi:MAG TPA: methyltransferase domain-containing protein [Hyphomicrobiales bacterium]|nr:methyltransferase domain-containing protein [Hyphomicrobiales bacterium]
MTVDVVDLRDFYGRPLGSVVRRILRTRLRLRWPDASGQRVLGFGYATPYLGLFREEAERVLAFMPAGQGVIPWPADKPPATALVEEDMWPLPDAAVDRILLVHGLEGASSAADLLRECWRCLAPGGRLLAIVPNRRGPWARIDTTPFGHGSPFSRLQLNQLLRESSFAPMAWEEALMFPPFNARLVLRSASAIERAGRVLWAPFAGALMVEATKEVRLLVASRRRRAQRMVLKPAPLPAGTPAPAPPG